MAKKIDSRQKKYNKTFPFYCIRSISGLTKSHYELKKKALISLNYIVKLVYSDTLLDLVRYRQVFSLLRYKIHLK